MVDAVVRDFEISLDGMRQVSSLLRENMEKGLAKEGKDVMVKMLVTYVHSLPDGSEEGDFLALDLGGSNFRVLLITLKDKKMTQDFDKYLIDEATKQSDQKTLFDFIAKCVADFCKKRNITKKLPLGFTFSFPVRQTSLTSGTLIRWTKDFTAKDCVGHDVVKMLVDAFQRRGDINIDVVALLNDTTGTQLAVGFDDPNCHVGLILGTGTNACYTERIDTIPKYDGDRSQPSHVVINMEWGAFGDDGALTPWLTEFDKALDDEVENKGEQIHEKCISGRYLGEIVRLVLQKLVSQGVVFSGAKVSDNLRKYMGFDSKYLSIIEGCDNTECKRIFKKDFSMEVSDADCDAVKRVCEAVSTRAARLAGAGVVTVVKKIDKLSSCAVAVDGSLYKLHPKFSTKMREAMDELAPGNGIVMKLSEDGSGRGAAVVAAVATRLKKK